MLDQSKTIRKFFLNSALRKTAVALGAGETDEPVTCDVKRLIRLPYSLHGKTGFQVVKIDIDSLDSFNPLNDAVVFNDETVNIHINKPYTIMMKQQHFQLDEGECDVPLYLAIFLIGRRMATII
jgi:DNA primase small subunit